MSGEFSVDVMVDQAKLAEQAERYDDMAKYMKELTEKSAEPLTDEQRNLLSVAFKNVVGARRSAWRIISSIEQKAMEKNDDAQVALAAKYRKEIEEELLGRCGEVCELIEDKLIPSVTKATESTEPNVFYTKMKGDYLRYMTEVTLAEERKQFATKAKKAYEDAADAAAELAATHPIKLGLCLNHSVFCYEIENDAERACELAKKAFDDAIAELDNLKEDSYKDSTLIMQLLRDNLTLWMSEKGDEDDNAEDQ